MTSTWSELRLVLFKILSRRYMIHHVSHGCISGSIDIDLNLYIAGSISSRQLQDSGFTIFLAMPKSLAFLTSLLFFASIIYSWTHLNFMLCVASSKSGTIEMPMFHQLNKLTQDSAIRGSSRQTWLPMILHFQAFQFKSNGNGTIHCFSHIVLVGSSCRIRLPNTR